MHAVVNKNFVTTWRCFIAAKVRVIGFPSDGIGPKRARKNYRELSTGEAWDRTGEN